MPYSYAATLDTEPLAKSYPDGIHTHLLSNHFQYARAFPGSSLSVVKGEINSSLRQIHSVAVFTFGNAWTSNF